MERRFSYQPSAMDGLTLVATGLLFVVLAAAWWRHMNGAGHATLGGAFRIPLGTGKIIAAGVLVLGAGAFGLGIASFVARLRSPGEIRLSSTALVIALPGRTEPDTIPYSTIRSVDVKRARDRRTMEIVHLRGNASIRGDLLPTPEAFDELHAALLEAKTGADLGR